MIQPCLQCDRIMHLRGGDMTTTCAECHERNRHDDNAHSTQRPSRDASSYRGAPVSRQKSPLLGDRASEAEQRGSGPAQASPELRLGTREGREVEHPLPRSQPTSPAAKNKENLYGQPHELDARALKARLSKASEQIDGLLFAVEERDAKLEDRERVIAAFREKLQEEERISAKLDRCNDMLIARNKKLEAVTEAARSVQTSFPRNRNDWFSEQHDLHEALVDLDAKEGG